MDSYVFFNDQDEPGLYLVQPPQSPTAPRRKIQYTCDIFLVHGLNGGPTSTWRHPETGVVWFKDLLPEHLSRYCKGMNARIWTFGYNANVAFETACKSGTTDFARALLEDVRYARKGHERNKIIWICYSLGGIVVKTALIESILNPALYGSILPSTAGILFLGTPHRGSATANIGSIAARIAKKTVIFETNTGLLRSLERDSKDLFDKANQFCNICETAKIYSFYETLSMGRRVIVERESALTGMGGEVQRPLDADHRRICKFKDGTDQNWVAVRSAIAEIMALIGPPSMRSSTPDQRRPRDAFQGSMDPPFYPYNPPGPPRPSANPVQNPQWQFPENSDPRQAYTQPPSAPYNDQSGFQQSMDPTRGDRSGQYPYGFHPGQNPASPPPRPPYPSGPPDASRLYSPNASDYPTYGEASRFDFGYNNPYSQGRRTPDPPSPQPAYQDTHYQPAAGASGQARGTSPAASYQSRSRRPTTESRHEPFETPNIGVGTDSRPKTAPMVEPKTSESVEDTTAFAQWTWICDACLKTFSTKTPRIHCLECEDYDLCTLCYQRGKVSDSHSIRHRIRSSIATRDIPLSDLVLPDIAIPEFSPPRKGPNWTVKDKNGGTWFHLRNNPRHARFLESSVPVGAYTVALAVAFKTSAQISAKDLEQLKGTTLGKLSCVVGTPKSRRSFFRDAKPEDDSLAANLFKSGSRVNTDLKFPDNPAAAEGGGHEWSQYFELPSIVEIKSEYDSQHYMGCLMQWSNVPEFEDKSTSVLSISLVGLRLQELLEYDADAPAESLLPPTPTPSAAARTPAPPQQKPSADEDSDDEQITISQFFSAILQELKDPEDQMVVRKVYTQVLEQQANSSKPITVAEIMSMIAAQKQREQAMDNLRSTMALLRLQNYIEEVEKKKKAEEQRRIREAQTTLAFLSLFN
ncbi:MAG: hypothetical protein M1839_004772 [Geoglossum umbratile]|nr:MAG: hypothetical protein M1839_004772 [Geoglossum umbratile]